MNKKISLLIVFAVAMLPVFAQNLAKHNWYFGNSVKGIRFNRSTNLPAVVNNKALPFGTGGSAVATDPGNANLLFYTDGSVLYDAYHQTMPGTSGLTGNNSANQPVAISKIPGAANKYFVFTNSASFPTGGAISRLVIDMAQFGNATFPSPARGAGEGTVTAITSLTNRSEGMITVPHANKRDFWLISHQANSQSYSATLINAASYTAGTFTTTVTSGLGLPTSVANFSYNAVLKKIAVSPQDTNTDAIILNFNDATGVFSFDRTIFNSGVATTSNESVYDIEWSSSGRYLYLSRHGETGVPADLLQYDYLNPTTTLTTVLPSPVFRSFGLQMAPDSAIYHLYQATSGGPFLAGKIAKPDTVVVGIKYQTSLFAASDFKGTQFPSFTPRDTISLKVNFTFIGTCQNSPTTFFPDVTPGADSLRWDFGDTTQSKGWSPVHTFKQAKTYNVKLTAFYQGQIDSVKLPVTITAFPLKLQLTQDTTACRSEFPPPRGSSSPTQFSVKVKASGGNPTSYAWSNGDIGQTLTPDSAGYYYVVVTDASGCTAYAGVNVKEYGLQNQTFNKWYFGNKAGIDFNLNPPKALSESAMDAPEGCAIVCDRNGQQIFYSDGDKVYNKKHVEIDSGIGGDPASTQSVIIIPVTGDETLYYIFTTQAINGTSNNEVRYSLFDLKKNNGQGAVVKKNVLLFSKSTERLTANGQWLIVHEYGNNTFRSYPVSANGIGDPVYSSIGSDHEFTSQQNGEGYMKLGPLNTIAVALSTPGVSNLVELFHLNDTTGQINNYRKIDLKEPAGQVYGVEFSPSGSKLFATVKGSPSPSALFEYAIDSIGKPHFKQRIQQAAELGEIQRAPNGQVYVAINGSAVLGTIGVNSDTTQLSSYTPGGFNLASGTTSKLGLPNFIQINSNASGGPAISVTGICVGDSTTISGSSRDQIDEYNWQVRKGTSVLTTSKESTFSFLFPSSGVYTISLRLHNRCAADTTLTQNVTIYDPPKKPGGAAALCTGAVALDANTINATGLTYLWSTAETTQTITVNQQGIYTVDVTDSKTGCVSNGSFMAIDNRPQVELGPDLTICQNTNVNALDAQNPGATYQWTLNGANASTTQIQNVVTSTAGVFAYAVTVTDPVTTCFVTDTKTYTIKTSPDFTFTGSNPVPPCGSATGSVTLKINTTTPATGPYSYFITGTGLNKSAVDQTAPLTVTSPNLKAGTYSVTVSDQISGCALSSSVGLSDVSFNLTPSAVAPNCDPVTVRLTTDATLFPLQYTITSSSGQSIGSGTSVTSAFNTSPALKQGTYTFQVKDNGGCIRTTNFPVTPNSPVTLTLNPNICNSPASITASGASSYTWSGPGIVSGGNAATVQVNPGQGQFTYSVTGTAAGQCPNTQTITVRIDNAVKPTFTASDACQSSVTLVASPSGNYTYRWYKNGEAKPSQLGKQLTVTASASYVLEILNTVNGCSYKTAPTAVTVTGPVTASLTSTPPCDDGQPFTLTATTNATGVTYAWSLDKNPIASATTATLNQTSNGVYKVDISKGTCKASASLNVTKSPLPVGKLPDRVIICNDPDNKDVTTNHVDLDPGAFTSYNWFKNDLPINYKNRVYSATSEGLYEVEITNTFNCKVKDKTDVLNQCIPKLVAPNAFKPSSLITANKEFSVLSFFITDDFEVFIYNRWGELVFQSKDRYFKWNGGYNNNASQLLPGGSYAYILRYVSAFRPDLGKQEQRGGVALLR